MRHLNAETKMLKGDLQALTAPHKCLYTPYTPEMTGHSCVHVSLTDTCMHIYTEAGLAGMHMFLELQRMHASALHSVLYLKGLQPPAH